MSFACVLTPFILAIALGGYVIWIKRRPPRPPAVFAYQDEPQQSLAA